LIHVLWDGRDKIDCIRVMSWEPYIPWELVKLALAGEHKSDDRFLSQYGMVRWLNGPSAARELPLQEWSYYAASYPNNPAEDVTREIEYLTTELPKRNIQPTRVASTYDAFVGALQNPSFDVLHVACHGDVKEDDIEKAELVITDELVSGRPKYVSISATVVGRIARLWPKRPLVFLNACEAGRLGESLTAWGGWPKKLIGAGAGAVVGASWPVRDIASTKFSTAFYEALLAGDSLADAASAARTAASSSGDATWAAFRVFGDPHATQSKRR
jgi:CHAT domain-containing protein